MSDETAQVEALLIHSQETLGIAREVLGNGLPLCADLLVQGLLMDAKVLVCGNGGASALAQLFTSNMLNRFERERPSLPALCLGSDQTTVSAIASDTSLSDIFAKPIRALGRSGDLLLCISGPGRLGSMVQAVQAAHDREMRVIAFTSGDGGDVASLLRPDDVEVRIAAKQSARVLEVQLVGLHILCALIDQQLFGPEEH